LPDFELERWLIKYEMICKYGLHGSEVVPLQLKDLIGEEPPEDLLNLRLGYHLPTKGSEELRNRISELYSKVNEDNILVTIGTSEANFITTNILFDEGDEVIVEVPSYGDVLGELQAIGAKVKYLYLKDDDEFVPNIDLLNELVTRDTKGIYLCNPNNPTGSVLTERLLKSICEIANDCGAYLFIDELVRGLEYDGRLSCSAIDLYDKAVVTGGFSKGFALSGLRLGWIIGPAELVERSHAFHDYTTITIGTLSGYLALRALERENRRKIFERSVNIIKNNLSKFIVWMNDHKNLFDWVAPKAGATAFPAYRFDMDSTELCERLVKEYGLLAVPGDAMGVPKHLRLNIGQPEDELVRALQVFDSALKEIAV